MKITKSGKKITITGPAGCGKTTEAKKMKLELEAQGKKVFISEGQDITPDAEKEFDIIIETLI